MSNAKYDDERAVVELFAAAGGLTGTFSLERGQDPPDVIVRAADRLIGIEVRRLFEDECKWGSPQRRHLRLSRAIVERANAIHANVETASYMVHVRFCRGVVLRGHRVDKIARALVRFAQRAQLTPGQERTFPSHEDCGAGWPHEVESMNVTLIPDSHGVFWGLSDSEWVGRVSNDLLQRGLDAKERRLRAYPAAIQERWLLLYCDGSVGASLLDLPAEVPSTAFYSSFDRALVLDYTGRRFMDLPITASMPHFM